MPVAAFPAATVILARERAASGPGTDYDVFLIERPAGASFMAGAHVFPGGRLDARDADPRVIACCDGVDEWPARMADDPAFSLQHGVAAIRELFEEACVLLARPVSSEPRDGATTATQLTRASAFEAARRALHAGQLGLADLCVERGWRLTLDWLQPLSRWITPEGERRRFDTAFFVARLPRGQEAAVDGAEAVSGTWLCPAEAVERHMAGRMALAPPTLRTLYDLSRESSLDAALVAAKARAHFPVLPKLHEEGGRKWLLLPGDPLYPAASEASMPAPTRFRLEDRRWVAGPQG